MNSEQNDFITSYLKAIKETESPWIYHRWCAISGIAALLGRSFYLNHGNSQIFPNFYTMLIGSPGVRKSTAIKSISKLLQHTGYNTFTAGKTSKEKFLVDLSSGFEYAATGQEINEDDAMELESFSLEPKEVFVNADEFQDFMGANNVEFISLLTTLWDCLPSYAHRVKNSKSVYINEPTINILSGNTPTGFATTFPPEIIGQGMLSRLLLIYGESTGKRIAFPTPIMEEDFQKLGRTLQDIKAKCQGECQLTEESKKLLTEIYTDWKDIDDARLKSYSSRRFTHLLKLCLICAASKCSSIITKESVILANTILTQAESFMPMALGEFGKSKHANVAGKILQFLEEKSTPIKINTLWKLVHQDLEKMTDLATILMNLENAEKVQKVPNGGGFLIRKSVRSNKEGLVDFKLLEI